MKMRLICTNLPLTKGPSQLDAGTCYRIGRSSRCAFVLTDLSVSRQHAEVTINGKGIVVRDLGSRNGTFVDGLRVMEAELAMGQSVRFGNAEFQLMSLEVAIDHQNSEVSTYIVHVPAQPATIRDLSATQRRVLSALLKGMSEKAVASALDISPHTVHNHVKEIYRRMDVSTRSELLALFVGGGKKPLK